MEKEIQSFGSQTENSAERPKNHLEHSGEIILTNEEKEWLKQAVQGQFDKHPFFEGVEILQLSIDMVPASILEKIKGVKGKAVSFVAIKIKAEVPMHQHVADNEIYLGGSDGVVVLLNESKEEIGRFALSENTFTVANTGEWHGVSSNGENGSIFFGVKFVVEEDYHNQ